VAKLAEVTSIMRAVPIFAGLLPSELNRIALVMKPRQAAAGELICTEGDSGHEFYVLADGKAQVERHGRPVARLHAGDYFGELALLDRGPRTATVRVLTNSQLYVLTHQSFAAVLDDVPALAQKLLAAMAAGLRDAESRADAARREWAPSKDHRVLMTAATMLSRPCLGSHRAVVTARFRQAPGRPASGSCRLRPWEGHP
jgi:CRP/FNR family transcriptional regulator, cyclic AMP receptor protein